MPMNYFKTQLGKRLLTDVKEQRISKAKALKVFRKKTGETLPNSLFYLKSLCYLQYHCTWENL